MTAKITTNQNPNYLSLIARCNNIKSLFEKNTRGTYYEFADLFFNISGTDTTDSVPVGTNFDNKKKYISYLLYDAIKGEIDSIEYDKTTNYLKASSNTKPLYFIKSDNLDTNFTTLINAAADAAKSAVDAATAATTAQTNFNTINAAATATQDAKTKAKQEYDDAAAAAATAATAAATAATAAATAISQADSSYRYHGNNNKIKYIFCTLRLIETFLDILSAYKNYIDDPANDGKIINNIIITDCKNTNKVGNDDYNHGYFVESDDGDRKIKDGSSLLLYIKGFATNPLLTSNSSYYKLNSTEYNSSGSNTSTSYEGSNNTFNQNYLRGIFIKKSDNTIKLTIQTGGNSEIKDLNSIKASTYNDDDTRYKIICNYYLIAFLELIYYLKPEKRNEQIEALISQLEIYKLSIYTCIYACNKLFNTFLEKELIDNTNGVRKNTKYHCILPHAITSDKIIINTSDTATTEIYGKLNDIFSEIYGYTAQTPNQPKYGYYTTYFSNSSTSDENAFYKKDTTPPNPAVVSTPSYIVKNYFTTPDNLPSKSLSTEKHYYKFNKLNDNIYEHINKKTKDLINLYYKGTNSTIVDIFDGGNNFAIEIHDKDRNICVVKTPKDILRNIILHEDFDDTITGDDKQLIIKNIPNGTQYYTTYNTDTTKEEKKYYKNSYLNSIVYGLNKSKFLENTNDYKKYFSDIELYKYKIVNEYIVNINENNYNIKNIYYDENNNLVISIYAEDIKKLLTSANSPALRIKDIKTFNTYSSQDDINNGYNFIFNSPNSIKIIKKTPIQFKNNYNNNIKDINDLNDKININQSKLKNYKTLYELNKTKNTIMYNQYYAYLIISIIIFCVLIGINFYPMENSIKKLSAMVCFGIAIMLFISYFVVNVAYIEGFAIVEGFAIGAIGGEKYEDFLTTSSSTNNGTTTITIDNVKEFESQTLNNKKVYIDTNMITLQNSIFGLLIKFEIYRRQASSGSAYYKLTEITENERRIRYNIDNRLLYEKDGANMHIDVLKYETLRYSIIIKSILMALFIITGMYTIFLYINGKNMEIIVFITLLLLIIVFCYFLIYSNSIVRTKSKNIYWGKAFESTYEK